MDTIEALETRRAIKHFVAGHAIAEDQLQRILSAAMLAPSAFNIQHTRLVVVRDEELRRQIRKAAFDQAQVTDASVLIVVCADVRAWEKEPARYWRNAPDDVREQLVGMIDGFYRGREAFQRDEAMRSCGLTAMALMLAARAEGLDTCPMDGFDPDRVAELIRLPDDHVVAMFVALGRAARPPYPRPGQLPLKERVVENRFA